MTTRHGACAVDTELAIPIGDAELAWRLTIPRQATGVVLFAHGSGSSRFSPRNQFVAGALRDAGLGTLLMDLLTRAEEEEDVETGWLRFDVQMLGQRVVAAADWLAARPELRGLRIGLFGASTGAAAALLAARDRPALIDGVVSRGGRLDLAREALGEVRAPTLLIVGGDDPQVLALNRMALAELRCEKHLAIVPGASHLFEEPGTLEQVAELAAAWFERHLGRGVATRWRR